MLYIVCYTQLLYDSGCYCEANLPSLYVLKRHGTRQARMVPEETVPLRGKEDWRKWGYLNEIWQAMCHEMVRVLHGRILKSNHTLLSENLKFGFTPPILLEKTISQVPAIVMNVNVFAQLLQISKTAAATKVTADK
jgi:hypothetical protein